jgi:hypothetical protein
MSGVNTAEAKPQGRAAECLFALFAVACLVTGAHSQTHQEPPSQAPVFNENANEVSLDLVVHDKKNRLVVDLKPEEIAVYR